MYSWHCLLEYFSSSDSRSCCFRMSSAFTIWRHWSTWAAWCWISLGNLYAPALAGTGSACGGRSGRWNYFPFTVRYMVGCISILMRPCCPPTNSYRMIDVFAWIFSMDFEDDFVVDDSLIFFPWRVICCKYLQFLKSFLFFVFTKFGVLDFFLICMDGSRRGSVRIFCACWTFFLASRIGSNFLCLVPFLVSFKWITLSFFSCFVWLYPIRRHLNLVVMVVAPDVCFI